ncbi:hypothetical protein AABB24_012178 [Solanum stoloniferum]|uniref:DUF1985 domain-containing protein n=1 Tax=Solanum stoloniferum TaxID=62892 RepID=A0ABD2U5C8_9SOLN
MSETNTPRRITRGSIAAMEIEKKSKFLNIPIKLDLNDELVRSGSSKRKEGSTMKVAERKIDKRRKVKDVVSGMIGKHVVNEEQEERSEEELEGIRFYMLARPIEPPRMQVYVNHNIVTDLKGKLTPTQFNQFKDICFGAYTKMHVCWAQPQIFRCLMVCELEDSSLDELFFRINHTTLRFGIQEFAIITGLNCFADKDDFLFDTSEPNRLINQYFEGKSIIRKAELISKYKNKVWGDGNDDDAIKFAIVYFISTFIYSGEKKSSSIPRIQFDLVESGRYNEYPWGKNVFSKLVKSITKKMDAKKKYYRIDGMPLAMQVWIYECCSAVDLNIAKKKTNRIPRLVNWRTRNSRIHYEFLMEEMFGDNGNPLKYKNIQPSLKEIAFYQLPSKSDAIPENTFQKVGDKDDDEDDDFTLKPPSHKPHNKEKGKQKVTVSLSTSIKKFNMHVGSSCKEKSSPVLHGYRKAKSTPFRSVSTPVKNNAPVQELHNQPDDSAKTTPPMSSKQPQDTKAGKIGVLRQDLASFKDFVTNEFKELRLFILENFKQVMDAVNKSNPQSGAPCQEDGSKSPTHVPDWSNNNSMKDGNQISTFLDKPHFDINEDQTFRFVLEEHVRDNVQENYQPAQIHIQDPLSVHEQSNGKQPVGMPSFETGDINALQNDGIQQSQSQFELLDVLLPSLDTINPKKCVVVHPEGVVYDTTPVPVQRTRRPDRLNSSSYSTNFGSLSGCMMKIGIRIKKQNWRLIWIWVFISYQTRIGSTLCLMINNF